MATTQEQLLLRNMPPELKVALMQAAEYGQTNMQAVALTILSEHYKVKYEPKHGRGQLADSTNLNMNLRLPADLHRKLRVEAARDGIAYADKAILILGDKLGVEIPNEYVNRRGWNKRAQRQSA